MSATIWGHTEVHVEKVVEARKWIVSTVNNDPSKRQVLVEVPWTDAFKSFPHAPDYAVAVATCQADESTALTEDEEEMLELLDTATPDVVVSKVVSLADFRARRRT
jgi:hypothetical protein